MIVMAVVFVLIWILVTVYLIYIALRQRQLSDKLSKLEDQMDGKG